ncbi:recombinase family protein [Streptomyces sp. DSM 44915]|uniref:Recombinase family protein n=1 Tax=Streptomyces chisholmiae TaxID=3075540 RepID=A0ABU2JSM1_9ACTN|nr:recombinase family protein [Streptomyces sp. DSM 44915]MDT0267993.1 recombinase family protein [Streptomyces sp. DSM 44915]
MAATALLTEPEHPLRSTPSMETVTAQPGTDDTSAPMLRGLRGIRLSVLTDETTSPERQREADDRAAREKGISFGEGDALREAIDLGVSASKTSPFERPELGAWLRRPDEYDALVFWRFDRAIRSMVDMHDLARWAREHKKMIVFAEGIGGGGTMTFDFRNPMDPVSEFMMMMFAFAAQVEAMSIKERVIGAQAAMRTMPLRWRGSRPPYGYMPVKLEGGGWTLIPDPDAVKVIEWIIRELMTGGKDGKGKAASLIAVELNEKGIPSPRDHWAIKQGRETGGKAGAPLGQKSETHKRFKWSAFTIRRLLTSPAMLGWKVHKGKPVRDAEGRPVLATNSPIMDRAEYDVVCAVFERRAKAPRERKDSKSVLLRVAHCSECGSRMYVNPRKDRTPIYRCSSLQRGITCPAPAGVRADWAESFVEREFLSVVGDIPVREVREIPGYDPAPEIAATLAEFEEHQKQEGRQKSKAAAAAWQRHADALDSRLAELEATPKVEARREVTDTGQTYADLWASRDTQGKQRILISAGARLDVSPGRAAGWKSVDESRLRFTLTGGDLDDVLEELRAVTLDNAESASA